MVHSAKKRYENDRSQWKTIHLRALPLQSEIYEYETRTLRSEVSSFSFYIYVLCVCVVYFVCVVLLIQCPEP